MSEYLVESKSRNDLRILARQLRRFLHLENILYFPIVQLLDALPEFFADFSYEIVPDSELPYGVHADTDVRTGHIRIRESVYERACKGEGRDRMTIAHEVAHYVTLCACGFRLERNFSGCRPPAYRDPEWQAKCFAGELMVAAHLCYKMSSYEIADRCGVSQEAARCQHKHLSEGVDAVCGYP